MTPEQATDKVYAATGVLLGTDKAPHIASYMTVMEARVTEARRAGLEEAAKWHDHEALAAQFLADQRVSKEDEEVWSDYAKNHREFATAIRALMEKNDDQ